MRTVVCEVCSEYHFSAAIIDDVIEGAFSDTRWSQLIEIADLIYEVLVAQCNAHREDIAVCPAYRSHAGSYTATVRIVQLRCSAPIVDAEPIVRAVARVVMTNNASQFELLSDDEFVSVDLSDDSRVSTFLRKKGGRKISQPVKLEIGGRNCGILAGKFAARPKDIVVTTTKELVCVVEKLDTPARRAVVRCQGNPQLVSVRFAQPFRFDLGMSIARGQPIRLHVVEELDAQGRKFLCVCNVENFTVADFELER